MTVLICSRSLVLLLSPVLFVGPRLDAQKVPASSAAVDAGSQDARVERLMQAVERAEARIRASELELDALKEQLRLMKVEMAASPSHSAQSTIEAQAAEQAALEESQIATLDQAKVESVSKFPLRVSGTVLLNGFFNTGRVDQASAPTSVLGNNNGTAGIALRQTILGLDAEGPHLLGASSHADLRVDFFGNGLSQGYDNTGGLLRLRTAHASLDWTKTQLFFSLDRPILNPQMPESLVSAAQPELAWSGNLWSWNPQLGITQTFGSRTRVRLQVAVIDPTDPTLFTSTNTTNTVPANDLAEASQRPGLEARLAFLGSDDQRSPQFGFGGYFSPHVLTTSSPIQGSHFDAWAGTMDYRLPLPYRLDIRGNVYRGQSLGGLGGGAYKDYLVRLAAGTLQFRALDDVGGWSQLHQTVSLRVQWNVGFGIDNGFARELEAYSGVTPTAPYQSIARNRTFFANVIYSPRSSILFSLEYRNLYTAPVGARVWTSNTTGVGAAYRF